MSRLDDAIWSRLIRALLTGLAAVAFITSYLARMLPRDLGRGSVTLADALLAADITGLLIGLAVLALLGAVQLRQRRERRRAASAGAQYMLPFVWIFTDHESTEEVLTASASGEMVARWPHPRRATVESGIEALLSLAVVVSLGPLFVAEALTVLDLSTPSWITASVQWLASSSEPSSAARSFKLSLSTAYLAGLMFFGFTLAIAISWLGRAVAATLFQTGQLRLDDERVTWISAWGRRRHILVRDVRLVEVAAPARVRNNPLPADRPLTYTIHGRVTRMRWTEPPTQFRAHLDGARRLADALCARTGLRARTFDRALLTYDDASSLPWLEVADFGAMEISLCVITGMVGVASIGLALGYGVLAGLAIFLGAAFLADHAIHQSVRRRALRAREVAADLDEIGDTRG